MKKMVFAVFVVLGCLAHAESPMGDKACWNSNKNQVLIIQNQIVYAREVKENAELLIAKDKRAAEISGYANIALRHQAANQIVWAIDSIEQKMAAYRKLGGVIKDPSIMQEVPVNLCVKKSPTGSKTAAELKAEQKKLEQTGRF